MLDGLPAPAVAIVMTTWAFGYFSIDERSEFVDVLRAGSERRCVIWISSENAGVVEALDTTDAGASDLLGAVLFDQGTMTAQTLAHVHGHGNWIRWLADS